MSKRLPPLDKMKEQAQENIRRFRPRFPGEGFKHTRELAANGIYSIDCPCSARMSIGPIVFEIGQAELISCPVCDWWHSVYFTKGAKQKSPFILAGKK